MKTIHLIRHGQSTFNAAFAETGADPLHRDARLTPLGHAQVAAQRQAYAGLGHELIVTSPLTRAIETTLGLFGGTGAPIQVEALHREKQTDSCDVGRSPSILEAEFPSLRFGHLGDPWWHDEDHDHRGIPIEPDSRFAERVQRFRAWIEARPERVITAVGHGTFFRILTGGRPFANCELFTFEL
ncbi:MAG: histidine phosphatase family protein [Proteobacteria bacterium]|nr:histidine phosphatase family protein [Pseudomonadota bacterium]MBI3497651.1 histidine phosphatase family protein [Pseudomonadota bacterium]